VIFDFETVEAAVLEGADLCIVGTGAAGIALAREFFGTDHKVLLLEAGGLRFEKESQDLYRSEVVGLPHNGVHNGRARTYGGTTTLWAGQALPLSPFDFEKRGWVPHSGWPISFDEVSKFYRRAEEVMKLPGVGYDRERGPSGVGQPPPYDERVLHAELSQFSNNQDFGVSYASELRQSQNVFVVTHANVTRICLDPSGSRVDALEVRSLTGRSHKVRSRQYVICCGAIETARLLLASDDVCSAGVGNERGLVGRYFQEHLHCIPIPIVPLDRKDFARRFNAFRTGGIKRVPKIAASVDFQRKHHTLNVGAEVVYPPDENSPIEAAKLLLNIARLRERLSRAPLAVSRIARSPGDLVGAAWRYAVTRQPAQDTSGAPFLGVCGEQAPNPESRIMLSEQRDVLGMRRSAVDWRLTDLEKHSICAFSNAVAVEFERLGLGSIEFSESNWPQDPQQFDQVLHDSNHHIGTARMSASPDEGVTNSDCRVHGIRNLFVASSAVFPTGGYSNPTLTIIAMAIRLAEHLKREA
jgi:choline dehydrogenase-like flavoprotein